VLLGLVTTGLRRSELCALDWRDLELDGRKPSLLVRNGKGGKPRRQPLPAGLPRELRVLREARKPEPTDPIFCGLAGGRLQETILADIIRRAAKRAGIEKHVSATRCATRPRRGSARRSATPASLPSTSATPISRPSRATPTSPATSFSMPRAGWSSSPHLRRSVPRRTRLQNLEAHKTCPAGRIGRGVGRRRHRRRRRR